MYLELAQAWTSMDTANHEYNDHALSLLALLLHGQLSFFLFASVYEEFNSHTSCRDVQSQTTLQSEIGRDQSLLNKTKKPQRISLLSDIDTCGHCL